LLIGPGGCWGSSDDSIGHGLVFRSRIEFIELPVVTNGTDVSKGM